LNGSCKFLVVELMEGSVRVAANVRGLAMLGRLRFVTPELKPNIVTVVDCDYK
jgi:hypothetical protein